MWFAPQMQARFTQTRLASRIHARAWGKRSSGMLRSTPGALIEDYSKPLTPRHCEFCQLVHSLFSTSVRQIGSPQMKISFSRSSLLTAIAIVILLSALPGAIRRVIQSGDPYLFTQRSLKTCGRVSWGRDGCNLFCSQQRQSCWACGTGNETHG
jgi:hypothetical protein